MHSGTSTTSVTARMVATSSAGSSTPGTPALTSSICAPERTWAIASALTRSIRPAVISAASTLRPVGLILSPIITNGCSGETTTSAERERSTVCIRPLRQRGDGSAGPGQRPRQQPRLLDHREHALVPADGDHVDAPHSGDVPQLVHDLDRDPDALGRLARHRRGLQAPEYRIGDLNPGDLLLHEARAFSRARHR